MSTLITARAAWVAALQASPELAGVNISTHGGSFDRLQLERYSKQAPALVLSLLRFDPAKQSGAIVATARWGLIGFTLDTQTVRRDESVVMLLEAAARVILGSFGGQNSSGAVSRGRDALCRNMFSIEIDKKTVAMWGMEFVQQLDLIPPADPDATPFSALHMTWDLAPRDNDADLAEIPEAEDEIDLT